MNELDRGCGVSVMAQHDYQDRYIGVYTHICIYSYRKVTKVTENYVFQMHFPCKAAEGNVQHVLSRQAIKKDTVFCLAENNREPQIDWQSTECQRFKELQPPAKGEKK